MSYYHLTMTDRKSIERYYQQKLTITQIAQLIGVNKSTISRELKRNPSRDHGYNAIGAQCKASIRRKNSVNKPKLLVNQKAHEFVKAGLEKYWSPEEIANVMPSKNKVSTATIYRAIKKRIFSKQIVANLRFYRKKHKNKSKKPINVLNSLEKNISTRAKSIEFRRSYGHWELDTIVLRDECGCHLATVVERKSRFAIVVKIPDKKAGTMTKAIIEAFEKFPLKYRKTLTVDNGMEFSDWRSIESALPGTTVYYCTPYSPWQRGTNENTNGLIRQFFPRKKLLPPVTDEYVSYVQNLLNNRPRKCLYWKSPARCFPLHFT